MVLAGATALGAMGAPAQAALYDTLSDFNAPASYQIQQGKQKNGTSNVVAGRSDPNAMFDGNPATFFSLGVNTVAGGPAQARFTVRPGETIAEGTVIEVTFTGSADYEEALGVYLGTESTPYQSLIGYLLNKDAGDGNASVVTSGGGITTGLASLSAVNVAGSDGGSFRIFDFTQGFSTIGFRDASGGTNTLAGINGVSEDGFDIGELRISTVPLPAAAWLFGSAFLGLCWLGRRSAIAGVGMLPR
jgi:hypothetical protein